MEIVENVNALRNDLWNQAEARDGPDQKTDKCDG
jgi:hypothetical protein